VGDTTNWEFAAVVAAVTVGLGGLLLFTFMTMISTWRIFAHANRALQESVGAGLAVQDLARHMATQGTSATVDLRQAAGDLTDLRRQADDLMEQQARLQDAVRNLVEAGVLGSDLSMKRMEDLEGAIRRLEEQMGQVAAAVANLGSRM
jgi:hypothetical protein